MSNGTLRKYIIADKRNFSTSWSMLPKLTSQTVDGFWGADAIEQFYNTTTGSFSLELSDGDTETYTYNVMFSDFSKNVVKRGSVDYWEISVTMEQV
jgi:ATP adenylyltransferase/5',5'''-P-1,P-4-tetraphosphate phosphorylase II